MIAKIDSGDCSGSRNVPQSQKLSVVREQVDLFSASDLTPYLTAGRTPGSGLSLSVP